jgi:hypothetical protein
MANDDVMQKSVRDGALAMALLEFQPGDNVVFANGTGPWLVVCGPDPHDKNLIECAYYNEVTGKFDTTSFTPGLLKKTKI